MPRFQIVPHRTQVLIDQGTNTHPVKGEAHRVTGFIEAEIVEGRIDVTLPVAARFQVPVARFTSGNSIYDREMHRVIDSRRYPTIEGELTSITPLEDTGRFRLEGMLTFHGTTEPVEGEVEVSMPSPDTLIVEGEQTFDIRRWGVEPPRLSLRVRELVASATVTVRVRITAERIEREG